MMASDREVMNLIEDVRSGRLPVHEESLVESVVAEAVAPSLKSSIMFLYNPDGTLKTVSMNNREFSFIWNSDGTLHKVNEYTQG